MKSHQFVESRQSMESRQPTPSRRRIAIHASRAGMPLWIVVVLLLGPGGLAVGPSGIAFGSGAAVAEDDRPTEVPYDMPGTIPLLDPEYSRQKHEVVIITDQSLQPRTVHLEKGQLVAWISYARAASMVVFEREVAKSMICHSLVNFSIKEDELRSAEIHTGEFASFCELKPGRYRYKVVRRDHKAAGAGGARTRLEGEIIVGQRPGEKES